MVLTRAASVLFTTMLAFSESTAQAFVLLSGPEEAKLPAIAESPVIVFKLSTDHPAFEKKEEFLGGIYKDLDDDQFWVTLVQETMNIWNNVEGSYIVLEVEADSETELNPEDNTFAIKPGSLPQTAAASALPHNEDGLIHDCDITVSSKKQNARDLSYTLLHELGHCLGLGHNHSNYNAVMGYSRNSHRLWLSPDDKAGVIFLYQETGTRPAEELVGCGRIGDPKQQKSWPLIVAPLLVMGVSGWNARRRRLRPHRQCP